MKQNVKVYKKTFENCYSAYCEVKGIETSLIFKLYEFLVWNTKSKNQQTKFSLIIQTETSKLYVPVILKSLTIYSHWKMDFEAFRKKNLIYVLN